MRLRQKCFVKRCKHFVKPPSIILSFSDDAFIVYGLAGNNADSRLPFSCTSKFPTFREAYFIGKAYAFLSGENVSKAYPGPRVLRIAYICVSLRPTKPKFSLTRPETCLLMVRFLLFFFFFCVVKIENFENRSTDVARNTVHSLAA